MGIMSKRLPLKEYVRECVAEIISIDWEYYNTEERESSRDAYTRAIMSRVQRRIRSAKKG